MTSGKGSVVMAIFMILSTKEAQIWLGWQLLTYKLLELFHILRLSEEGEEPLLLPLTINDRGMDIFKKSEDHGDYYQGGKYPIWEGFGSDSYLYDFTQ